MVIFHLLRTLECRKEKLCFTGNQVEGGEAEIFPNVDGSGVGSRRNLILSVVEVGLSKLNVWGGGGPKDEISLEEKGLKIYLNFIYFTTTTHGYK